MSQDRFSLGGIVEGVGRGVSNVVGGVGSAIGGILPNGNRNQTSNGNNNTVRNKANMTILWYDQGELPVSKDIVKCINDYGWSIVEKMSLGIVHSIYWLSNGYENAAIVINKYVNRDNLKHIRLLQKRNELDIEYMIEVYEPLICTGQLVQGKDAFKNMTHAFTVVEKPDLTLAEYVYNRGDVALKDKKFMIKFIYEDLVAIFSYLQDIEYSYTTKSLDGFAYRNNSLILINLAALQEGAVNTPEDIADSILLYEVIPVLSYHESETVEHEDSEILMEYFDEISGRNDHNLNDDISDTTLSDREVRTISDRSVGDRSIGRSVSDRELSRRDSRTIR